MFPVTVPVHVLSITATTNASCFQNSLPVVSGHIYIFAWYVAMYDALSRTDVAGIAALWQCGLTISTQVRVGLSDEGLSIWSLQSSEARKTQERLHSDTFPAFALKALLVGETCSDVKRLKLLNNTGITFNGARMNRSMVATITMFRDCISKQSVAVMHTIALRHGREVLSGGYTKIARIGQLCSEIAKAAGEQPSDLVLYVLEYLSFALRMGTLKPQDITVVQLDKSRDGGGLGIVLVILARRCVIAYLQSLVDDLRPIDQAKSVVIDFDKIMPHFSSYPKFSTAMGLASPSATPQGQPECEQSSCATSPGDPKGFDDYLESFKKSHCLTKVSLTVVEFMYDLLNAVYDDKLRSLAKDTPFKDINWATPDIDAFRELVRQLNMQRSIVDVGSHVLPAASSRVFRRYASENGGDDVEQGETLRERAEAGIVFCISGLSRRLTL